MKDSIQLNKESDLIKKIDGDEIRYYVIIRGEEKRVGYAYLSKSFKQICMLRCPLCERENYAMRVAAGDCAWCGYNPNNSPALPAKAFAKDKISVD